MRYRDTKQNRLLYMLINQLNIDESTKMDMVSRYTNGRTASSSQMYWHECQNLINFLKRQGPDSTSSANTMRRKILYYFHQLGWEQENGKVNMEDVEKWMHAKSYLNKSMNKYTPAQLPKLVSQVYSMYKSHLNNV